jgi:hypothetical protein
MTYPKIIHWNYFEASKFLNIVYVQDEATEKEIKRLVFIPYMFKQEVPGITIEEVQIKSVKDLKNTEVKTSKHYQELEDEVKDKYKFNPLENGSSFNGFIYAPYLHIERNKILKEKLSKMNITNNFNFIKKELFYDEEFVSELLKYRPIDQFGIEDTDWQNIVLPAFLEDLKIRNKEIYKELLKYDRVKELDLTLSCLDKRMRVKDLSKGFVKLSEYFGGRKYTSYWDGEHIKLVFTDDKNYEYLLIKPTDETFVTVVDENTLKTNQD